MNPINAQVSLREASFGPSTPSLHTPMGWLLCLNSVLLFFTLPFAYFSIPSCYLVKFFFELR